MRFREWLQFTEAMKRIQLSPSKKYLTIAEMEWEYSDSRGNFSNRAKNSELKINEYIGKPPDHISNQFINQEVIVIEGMSWFSHHEGNVSLEAYVEYTNQETTGMKSVAIEDGSKINGFLVWRGPFQCSA